MLAEPKDAGFSFSHDINSHLASLSIAGNTIPTPDPAVEDGKALCGPDNLNAGVENQGQMKTCLSQVCRETVSLCCNSFLQQAGLNLLISMTVINNMLAKSVSGLMLPLIPEGSECAEGQVVKPLTGLSEKPALSGELAESPSAMPLRAPLCQEHKQTASLRNPGLLSGPSSRVGLIHPKTKPSQWGNTHLCSQRLCSGCY